MLKNTAGYKNYFKRLWLLSSKKKDKILTLWSENRMIYIIYTRYMIYIFHIYIHDTYIEQEECLVILQSKCFGNLFIPWTPSKECLFLTYKVWNASTSWSKRGNATEEHRSELHLGYKLFPVPGGPGNLYHIIYLSLT